MIDKICPIKNFIPNEYISLKYLRLKLPKVGFTCFNLPENRIILATKRTNIGGAAIAILAQNKESSIKNFNNKTITSDITLDIGKKISDSAGCWFALRITEIN